MSSLRVLRGAVDTFEVSYRGTLYDLILEDLRWCKEYAQQEEDTKPYQITGITFGVLSHGEKPWAYVLASEDLRLRISGSKYIPSVSVKSTALGLVTHGHQSLIDLATKCAHELGATECTGLSRLDICIDFQGWRPAFEEMRGMVCPATFHPIYPSVDNPETFQFGKDKIVMRLYNKTRELQHSCKGWMHKIWKMCPGYDPDKDVWRIEFQFRREALTELGARDPAKAFESLPNLIGFGLDWASLRIPQGASSDRWPIHPAWEQLRACRFTGNPSVRTIKAASYVCDFRRLLPGLRGYFVSAGAALGVQDLGILSDTITREIEAYSEGQEQFALAVGRRIRQRLDQRR